MKVISFIKNTGMAGVIAIVISILFVVTSVHAATTISTSVITGGSLNASTTLAVDSAATLYSTLNVTGLTTVVNASSTLHTNSGVSWLDGNVNFNGFATTTAATGNIATEGDIT